MTVEDPHGQNIWIRKDGATRRSAPSGVETVDCSIDPEGDFDLVDFDEEQPLAHTGQGDGLVHERPDDHKVRAEELFVPLEVQEEVTRNLPRGWI
eukprot:9993169-Prorocentrum_lima.AAC.1